MSQDSTLNERVAEEIRVMLARRNITASELARRAGMTQRSISRRITGEKAIDMDDLESIARVLEVEVSDLLPTPALRDERGAAPARRETNRGLAHRTERQHAVTKSMSCLSPVAHGGSTERPIRVSESGTRRPARIITHPTDTGR